MQEILDQVRKAYSDCWMPWEEGSQLRDLDFRASEPVSRDEAREIMQEAIPNSYNAFQARLLLQLPADSRVTIAREGSVCIYVKGKLPDRLCQSMLADEFTYDPARDETRIWWD
jgi:hypothetical protein